MDNRQVIEDMTNYLQSYPKQRCWESYSPETILNDLVYGIGISIDEKCYSYADGYRDFKRYLIEFLEKEND